MTPSKYQSAIYDWIANGNGHGVVEAVAGGGKTTTLVQAADRIRSEGLFVAFNKHIAAELGTRLRDTPMIAKTIHSVGMGAVTRELGRCKVEDRKYRTILRNYAEDFSDLRDEKRTFVSAMSKLVSLVRLNLIDPEDQIALAGLLEHHWLYEAEPYLKHLIPVLTLGNRQAEDYRTIDFDDMIYLPNLWRLRLPRVRWLFVDEAQDLNRAQLGIALGCMDGRALFVGDPNQAIYGFAGADSDSIPNIKDATGAVTLPLSVCYRCPTSHLALAREIVPHIEARDGAPEGDVRYIAYKELTENLQGRTNGEAPLILCRTNAPIISAALRLLTSGYGARIIGRDLAAQLTTVLENLDKNLGTYDPKAMAEAITKWQQDQEEQLAQRDASPNAFATLADRATCLRTLNAHYGPSCSSTKELCRYVDQLFDEDQHEQVRLSTVHRAKGLEANHVFILGPELMPLTWANQQEWERQQEMNIKYVALTRAKQSLTFVELPSNEDA